MCSCGGVRNNSVTSAQLPDVPATQQAAQTTETQSVQVSQANALANASK